jgi:alkyldihydroxyacetonephosphate synthase
MAQGRLKVYGWGREGEGLTRDEEAFVVNGYHRMFGLSEFPSHTVPAPADYALLARQHRSAAPRTLFSRAQPNGERLGIPSRQ